MHSVLPHHELYFLKSFVSRIADWFWEIGNVCSFYAHAKSIHEHPMPNDIACWQYLVFQAGQGRCICTLLLEQKYIFLQPSFKIKTDRFMGSAGSIRLGGRRPRKIWGNRFWRKIRLTIMEKNGGLLLKMGVYLYTIARRQFQTALTMNISF